jgi:hypothetical protein
VVTEDFFGAGTEITVMAENWGEVRGILICDLGDRSKENREADGEDALFAAGEHTATEVESGEGGFIDLCGAEIVGDQADLFVLFGRGGDGFAELCEADHGGRSVSHGGDTTLSRREDWACLAVGIPTE